MNDNKEQQYYSCFKFYNEKKRRLSCFGRKINEEQLEILIWECDRRDTFNKADARFMYETYINDGEDFIHYPITVRHRGLDNRIIRQTEFKPAHPKVFTIPLEGQHPKQRFLDYLRENYYLALPWYKQVGFKYMKNSQLLEDENVVVW